MDFLNKSFAQISDLFKSMTPGARITAGLLLVVVVVSVAYLFKIQTAGPDAYLMGGTPFPPSDLPAVEAAFAAAKLNSYEMEGNKIRVPRSQKSAYMAALADAQALPPNFCDIFNKAIDSDGPFTSGQQREQKIQIAKQEELALIIRSMRGIQNAAVLYDTETTTGLRRKRVKTASVSVMSDGANQIDDEQVQAIRQLVAAAYAGLKPTSVAVIDLRSGRTIQGKSDGPGSAGDDAYFKRKIQYERQWQKKLQDALAYVPGVAVVANVTLDTEVRSQTDELKIDPKPINVYSSDKSSSTEQQGSEVAGRPGAFANSANALKSTTAVKPPHKSAEESEAVSQSVVSQTREKKETIGLTPKKVEVSVGLPSSYFESVWHERNPAAAGEEPKKPEKAQLDPIQQEEVQKITAFVARLLPDSVGVSDKSQLVTVSVFQDIKPPAIALPGIAENAMAWFGEYWGTLGMLGLAMFSLLMLRSMAKANTTMTVEPGGGGHVPASASATLPENASDEEIAASVQRLGRFTGTGPSLRDELSEIVNEDPDVAANVLRGWIGNVGMKS